MGKYVFIVLCLAAAGAAGLRIYGPYHDAAVFRTSLSDISQEALQRDDASLTEELSARARSLRLRIPPGGLRITRAAGGRSVSIHAEFQGDIDLLAIALPVDFSADVTRELSFPAMMIDRTRERVEKSVRESGDALEKKLGEISP